MILSQLKSLSKLSIREFVNLILTIAAMICSIIFILPCIFETASEPNVLYDDANFFGQIAFMGFMIEAALVFYAVLTAVEKFFIWIYKKIKNRHNFAENELRLEKSKAQKEIIKPKEFVKRAVALIGVFLLINGLLFYVFISSFTVVTDSQIIKKSVFNPVGTVYGYDDIERVEIEEDNGNPTYIMHMDSGKKVKLSEVSISDCCEIDTVVKQYGVPKTISCTKQDIVYYEDEEEQLEQILSLE